MTVARGVTPLHLRWTGHGVLFTDLDGTLLDFDTYRPSQAACAAVEDLSRCGILTVPVTSKTAAEVVEVFNVVRLAPIAVVEGGAVLLLEGGSTKILGSDRERMVGVLRALRDQGWALRGFSDMPTDEIADLTGLAPDAACRAMDRLASEPFVITSSVRANVEELRRRAAELGAAVTRGGRFWHLTAHGIDKGTGVDAVLEALESGAWRTTGAVGDAWNDLPMLARVAFPYFLGSRVPAAELPTRVHRIPEEGPDGFVKAALDFRVACA